MSVYRYNSRVEVIGSHNLQGDRGLEGSHGVSASASDL